MEEDEEEKPLRSTVYHRLSIKNLARSVHLPARKKSKKYSQSVLSKNESVYAIGLLAVKRNKVPVYKAPSRSSLGEKRKNIIYKNDIYRSIVRVYARYK